jgi:hypothetical protein
MAIEGESTLKLFEHPDFEQAIIRAAKHFHSSGIREAVIEKDYYVTEALRIIQQIAGDRVIFKGGTSLSKGWNIIHRFSEDVDIFFDPTVFEPPLGKNAINRELKKLRQAVEGHPGLNFIERESRTIGGFGRSDHFEYVPRCASTGDIRNRVLVEVGTASGREPTECVMLQSYVGQFLKQTGIGIGGYARHYYDLFCLAERQEVVEMLRSREYKAIKADYDKVSRKNFETDYIPPPDMNFAKSDAIFPTGEMEMALAAEFDKQCRILCFGEIPTWRQVQQRFMEMQDVL